MWPTPDSGQQPETCHKIQRPGHQEDLGGSAPATEGGSGRRKNRWSVHHYVVATTLQAPHERKQMKIVGIVGVAVGAVLFAACSSSPSTGAETISGSTTSAANNPTIPLKATGVFTDTGSITLGSHSTKGTLKFTKGDLNVNHSNPPSPNAPTSLNSTTCRAVFDEHGTFTVTGGTGPYKDATGHGGFAVSFAFNLPKLASGQCNESNNANPVPGTYLSTFKATGTITIQ